MANNSRYITFPISYDSRILMERAYNYLKLKVPGWEPAEGNLDVWMVEAFAGEAADIANLTTQVPKSIFRYFGDTLFGVSPINASQALVSTTWFMADTLGHTIPAGAQVGIRDSLGRLQGFRTLQAINVPADSTQTADGEVLCIAVLPGTAATNLGNPGDQIELIDPLAYVDHVTQFETSDGGVDAETDDAYLTRLALELQVMTPRPILAHDFAVLARRVAGVQRAAVIDNYNPATGTYTNERMVTVICVDAAGTAVGTPVKTEVAAYLDAMREINFVINTMDPTSVLVDVDVTVTIQSGYNTSDVVSRVVSAINGYLNPAVWGIDTLDDPFDPKTWNNQTTVYYLEVATLVNNVPGVDRVGTLLMGIHGGSQAAANVTMTGVVPLPKPNLITAAAI